MKRVPLTLITTIALFGVYRVYALVMAPMTKLRSAPVAPQIMRIEGAGHASHAAREAAQQFLAHHPWAQQAKFTWEHLDQKFIYFNEIGPVSGKGQVENKNQYRFRPFAMIVRNASRPDEPPTVLSADEARVTFKDKIEQLGSGDSNNNRIIGAELDTGVTLTGPHGLSLTGSSFVFSEATRSLYSDEPLQFTYGPTEKSASRFVCDAEDIAITLQAGDNDFLGQDLPRISDFEHLTLRRNVRFHIDYDNRGTLTPVRVSSAGSFEFNREQRKASFERDVKVVQRTSGNDEPPQNNVLDCQRLELVFDETPIAATSPADAKGKRKDKQEFWDQKMRSLAGLSLHYLIAFSPRRPDEDIERVRFVSEENALSATMEQITFDAMEGVLSLTDPVQSQIDRRDLKAGTLTRLLTRRMLLGLEQTDIESKPKDALSFRPVRKKFGAIDWVMCAGLGKLLHIDEATGETIVTATWQEKLSLSPDENAADRTIANRLLELTGDATIREGIDRGLRADVLTLTLPPDVFQSLDGKVDEARQPSLPIQRAYAQGHVQFAGLEAQGQTDALDVAFLAGRPPVVAPRNEPPIGDQPALRKAKRQTPPWDLRTSQRIKAEVVIDPETMDAGVQTASIQGPFEFHRPELEKGATDAANGAITITGHMLEVTNEGLDRQNVVLVGRAHAGRGLEPARVTAGQASLEGQRIEIDRADSTMDVQGTTLVRWPVVGDLTGRQLKTAMMMSVGCRNGLKFNGQTATFLKNVVVGLDEQNESRMFCEELIVALDRPITLSETDRAAARPEVNLIRSPGRTSVRVQEFEKNALCRVMVADLANFQVHPQAGDGSFQGAGPGTISQWQRGSFHFRVTPEASASANRPAASAELPWNFVQLDFRGQVQGNLHQQFATFNERVKAIYAPVAQAQTTFGQQELSGNSESAKRAVWVGCDQLNVSMSEPKPAAPSGFITLNAHGQVVLEAQKVQANAHQISFEEEKDIFELRGRGEVMASVYFDNGPGRSTVPGRVIQFNPRTGAHRIVEAGTVTGAQ